MNESTQYQLDTSKLSTQKMQKSFQRWTGKKFELFGGRSSKGESKGKKVETKREEVKGKEFEKITEIWQRSWVHPGSLTSEKRNRMWNIVRSFNGNEKNNEMRCFPIFINLHIYKMLFIQRAISLSSRPASTPLHFVSKYKLGAWRSCSRILSTKRGLIFWQLLVVLWKQTAQF